MNIALIFFSAFSLMLMTAAIMKVLEQKFMTHHVTDRSFDILDLQFPVNAEEMRMIINGIFRLSPATSSQSVRAVKGQLFVDFIFMPAAYGSIFILCWVAASCLPPGWESFFKSIGLVQALAWICDISENIFLLGHIKPYKEEEVINRYKLYQFFVYTKWLTAIIGIVCAISIYTYLLFSGLFPVRWYIYLGAVIAAVLVFTFSTRRQKKS